MDSPNKTRYSSDQRNAAHGLLNAQTHLFFGSQNDNFTLLCFSSFNIVLY